MKLSSCAQNNCDCAPKVFEVGRFCERFFFSGSAELPLAMASGERFKHMKGWNNFKILELPLKAMPDLHFLAQSGSAGREENEDKDQSQAEGTLCRNLRTSECLFGKPTSAHGELTKVHLSMLEINTLQVKP